MSHFECQCGHPKGRLAKIVRVLVFAGTWLFFVCLLALAMKAAGSGFQSRPKDPSSSSAEERAIAYLAEEVPDWFKENHCFSCHNNGDGARALYAARRLSYGVPEAALTNTTQWLKRPLEWDNNRGDPRFSDKKLARIQFAASLVEAVKAGLVENQKVLIQAAELLLPDQEADGSWQVDSGSTIGSPATYGACLATYLTRHVLDKADAARFQASIARANNWLIRARVKNMLDAAAVAIALDDHQDPKAKAKRSQCLDLILRGQASDGGWGPYVNSPSEPFDTAVVLLALVSSAGRAGIADFIRRGRAYLLKTQLATGGWPETTRPPGGASYAQHISTSGWATLALLCTRPFVESR